MNNLKNYIITSIVTTIFILLTFDNVFGQSNNDIIWPKPPNDPKVKFINSFSNSKNYGIKKSVFKSIWNRISGFDLGEESLVQPIGITGDNEGSIYVTDPGAKCVHIFNKNENKYFQINGRKNRLFVSPIGVAVSNNGLIYITDSELAEVQVFNKKGDYKFTIQGYFKRPTGICYDKSTIYITDTNLHKIFAFSAQGKYLFEIGRPGSDLGEYNRPIFIARKSFYYIVDALNYRVQIADDAFNTISSIGYQGDVQGTFSRPKGVAVDSDGNIYITDGLFDAIQIFDYAGQLLLVIGNSGFNEGEFDMPAGIYIDNNDFIYVVDTLNRRVQVFEYLKNK